MNGKSFMELLMTHLRCTEIICEIDLFELMASNRLKLNSNKTEFRFQVKQDDSI